MLVKANISEQKVNTSQISETLVECPENIFNYVLLYFKNQHMSALKTTALYAIYHILAHADTCTYK